MSHIPAKDVVKTTAQNLLKKSIAYFDIVGNSKVDLTTEGDKTIYRDPLNSLVRPLPSEIGHNRYDIHGDKESFRQEIHFQNGSPAQDLNGVSNEAIVAVVLHRLVRQNESFPSPYNVLAITLLQGVLSALHARVKLREDYGIYDTDKVEPDAERDAYIAKAIAVINSLGILGDIIIKFDSAYLLATPGRIQEYVEELSKEVKPDNLDITLPSAFSLSSAAVMGSGIFRGFVNIGSEMLKIMKGGATDGKAAEDNSANNAP